MYGIRKTENIVCPSCGAQGTIDLGMAMIGAHSDYREFLCISCRGSVPFRASRAIIDVTWDPRTPEKESAKTTAFR